MVESSRGWAHASVAVNASAETVEAFLDIVTTGEVALQWTSAGAAIASVARLADFLGRYQCEAAANILVKHLKEQAGHVLPPISLLLAGIHLKRPELTQFMLMRHDVPEPQLWSLPSPTYQGGMPFVPFEVYSLIPVEHQWALRMAGIQNGGQSPQGSVYKRFCISSKPRSSTSLSLSSLRLRRVNGTSSKEVVR